jgi:hypothetical protein
VFVLQVAPEQSVMMMWPWLFLLPLVGAAGAAWSLRHSGTRNDVLLVAFSPALVLLVLYGLSVSVAASSGGATTSVLLMRLINFVALPAIALASGVAPVLFRRERARLGA